MKDEHKIGCYSADNFDTSCSDLSNHRECQTVRRQRGCAREGNSNVAPGIEGAWDRMPELKHAQPECLPLFGTPLEDRVLGRLEDG